LEDYKKEKGEIDIDLARRKELRAAIAAQTAQARMDEAARNKRIALAKEAAGAHGLMAALVDKLIALVYIQPDKQIEIAWKMEDFCAEQSSFVSRMGKGKKYEKNIKKCVVCT